MKLLEMKRESEARRSALKEFNALSAKAPPDIAQLALNAASGAETETREAESAPLADGWTMRRTEVVFGEIDLDVLQDFLVAAESARPPWRLIECEISSSRRADGFARATLLMESAGKQ